MNPYFNRPRTLLVDNDPGRIEYMQNLLFRSGYQIVSASTGELERSLESSPRLVLSFLAIRPEEIAARGIPVLVMVPEGGSVP